MATVKRSRSKKNPEAAETAPPKPATSVASITTRSVDLQDAIRERAYELYLERGGHGGSPEQDWLRAQEEICGGGSSI